MKVEVKDFPRDFNGVFGNLREVLVSCLHKADNHADHARLLARTLATATSKIRAIYKEDGILSNTDMEDQRKKANASTAKKVKAAKRKLKRAKLL